MLSQPTTKTVSTDGADIQLLAEEERTVIVKARGNSLNEMAGNIFQTMRTQIFKEVGKPIIQLEAKEVYFDQVETEETEERFMLFFWPRTKTSYEVTARIVVNVKYLNINERN